MKKATLFAALWLALSMVVGCAAADDTTTRNANWPGSISTVKACPEGRSKRTKLLDSCVAALIVNLVNNTD